MRCLVVAALSGALSAALGAQDASKRTTAPMPAPDRARPQEGGRATTPTVADPRKSIRIEYLRRGSTTFELTRHPDGRVVERPLPAAEEARLRTGGTLGTSISNGTIVASLHPHPRIWTAGTTAELRLLIELRRGAVVRAGDATRIAITGVPGLHFGGAKLANKPHGDPPQFDDALVFSIPVSIDANAPSRVGLAVDVSLALHDGPSGSPLGTFRQPVGGVVTIRQMVAPYATTPSPPPTGVTGPRPGGLGTDIPGRTDRTASPHSPASAHTPLRAVRDEDPSASDSHVTPWSWALLGAAATLLVGFLILRRRA
ncbi:MAG: hypothetical protein H6837_01030 [Planctomycetes bacterium]|nr:hypothetical protein [Planctomycetota bacterium]